MRLSTRFTTEAADDRPAGAGPEVGRVHAEFTVQRFAERGLLLVVQFLADDDVDRLGRVQRRAPLRQYADLERVEFDRLGFGGPVLGVDGGGRGGQGQGDGVGKCVSIHGHDGSSQRLNAVREGRDGPKHCNVITSDHRCAMGQGGRYVDRAGAYRMALPTGGVDRSGGSLRVAATDRSRAMYVAPAS